jgi:flagellar motor switch protein FliN/FliY
MEVAGDPEKAMRRKHAAPWNPFFNLSNFFVSLLATFLPASSRMATAQAGVSLGTSPAGEVQPEGMALDDQQELGSDQALVRSPQAPLAADALVLSPRVSRLPVELDVSVPVRNFRVRNLLALEISDVIESGWGHEEDVPLAAGRVQLAWSEFEVVDTQLAVRVTRLA